MKLDLKLTKFKIAGLCGALVTLIGIFLPFLTAKVSLYGYSASKAVKLIDGRDGKVALVIVIIGAALLLVKKFEKAIYSCAGALLFIVLYDGVFDSDIASINDIAGASVSRSMGFYVMLIGIAAFAVGTFLEYKDNKETTNNVQPTYGMPQQPVQPQQPTYGMPQQSVQPQQPTYGVPQQPVQPQQPTYSAPQQDTFNQNNSNNNF